MKQRLSARHFCTQAKVEVEAIPTVCSPPNTSQPAEGEWWVCPGLIDVQVNGYAGIDFQTGTLSLADLKYASAGLRRDGCAGFFPTLITAEWPQMLSQLRQLKRLREQDAVLKKHILGWHLEGPFLSEQPGFCGAHNPAWMRNPSATDIDALKKVVDTDPVLITLAPERPGAIQWIHEATRAGFSVSLGHTNASASELREAIDAGARGFTHMGNAIPQELPRHNHVLWRMLDTPIACASLIPDGIHLPPEVIRTLWRAFGPDRFYFTTDAMAAAGAGPGRYHIGSLEVEVGAEQIVRQPGKSHFAGSALRPIDGVFRAASMLGIPWTSAWECASVRPLQLLFPQRYSTLAQRCDAHLVCVNGAGDRLDHGPVTLAEPL